MFEYLIGLIDKGVIIEFTIGRRLMFGYRIYLCPAEGSTKTIFFNSEDDLKLKVAEEFGE